MAEYNARIRQKRDTSANWTAKDPILLDGEIIIVDTASGSVRKKVGDGTKKYSQLPFDDEEMLTALAEKCDASNAVTATLTAAGWASGQQTLTIAGLGATQNGVIGFCLRALLMNSSLLRLKQKCISVVKQRVL